MSLSDMQCRAAKTREKPYKLFDGEGLYLEVLPSGVKSWRQKYRFLGKENRIIHGRYPQLSLLDARKKCAETKQVLRGGINPIQAKRENELTSKFAVNTTFEKVAQEWINRQRHLWTSKYVQAVCFRLERYAFPIIGNIPISEVKPIVMLSCLQKIEETSPETTRRVKALCSHVFRYGIATGRTETDPTYGLEVALKKFRKGHYASISVDEFPKFLLKMHDYMHRISRQTFLALKLLLLTFVRTAELIEAKREEFDLENKVWVIPAERMKMRLPHIVPLSRQSINIIKEMLAMHRNTEYLFPSYSNPRKPMCKNTMLVAIKRMGYNGRMTGHGFRSLALGLLKEKLDYSHEVADRQLAHVPKSSVDRAYDRALFLPQRTEMMQRYADYIDLVFIENITKRHSPVVNYQTISNQQLKVDRACRHDKNDCPI